MKKNLVIFLVLAVLLVGSIGWWLSKRNMTLSDPKNPVNYPSSQLIAKNDAYRLAREALHSHRLADAEKYLLEALNQDGLSERQKNYIRLSLAWVYFLEEKYDNAVSLEKDIIGKYTPDEADMDIKGFALQAMGTFPLVNTDDAKKLEGLIFTGSPYENYRVNGAVTEASYRQFFESALKAKNTLPIVNIYLAEWDANKIVDSMNSAEKEDLLLHIHQYITNGDSGISDFQKTDYPFSELQYIKTVYLARKGYVAKLLYSKGDTSLGTGESYYAEGVEAARDSEEKARALYYYAYYLSQSNDPKKAEKVQAHLSQIYGNEEVKNAFFIESFKNPGQAKKQRLLALAELDPKFREFLISLGWTESDFTQK